jgi:hypothetical protein
MPHRSLVATVQKFEQFGADSALILYVPQVTCQIREKRFTMLIYNPNKAQNSTVTECTFIRSLPLLPEVHIRLVGMARQVP